jgi:hypothetical protein
MGLDLAVGLEDRPLSREGARPRRLPDVDHLDDCRSYHHQFDDDNNRPDDHDHGPDNDNYFVDDHNDCVDDDDTPDGKLNRAVQEQRSAARGRPSGFPRASRCGPSQRNRRHLRSRAPGERTSNQPLLQSSGGQRGYGRRC